MKRAFRQIAVLAAPVVAALFLFLIPVCTMAQTMPERYYANGMIAKRDGNYERAFQAFRQSAIMYDARACDCLAECYQKGLGVAQNDKEAFIWYKRAAEEGINHAQRELSNCYAGGLGTDRDPEQASYWQKQAEEQLCDIALLKQFPSYPGGDERLIKRIKETCQMYPNDAFNAGEQGRVLVQFVVGKIGWIEDVEVIRSPSPSLAKAALECVWNFPKWKPGTKDVGNNVYVPRRTTFTLNITFRLADYDEHGFLKTND